MVLQTLEAAEGVAPCPVCDGEPRVLVVMRHPAMLRFTRQLLERECGCWVATEVRSGPSLARALDELTPDLLVIDAADFPACCLAALDHIPRGRVIVIGPELDEAYRAVAVANGAGGWLAREEVADKLSGEMRRVLGCRHAPCPPGEFRPSPAPRTAAAVS
jgi:DNA-binding NarL/FixJ family response regulator